MAISIKNALGSPRFNENKDANIKIPVIPHVHLKTTQVPLKGGERSRSTSPRPRQNCAVD